MRFAVCAIQKKVIKKVHTEHKARKAAKNVGVDEILDDDCFDEE